MGVRMTANKAIQICKKYRYSIFILLIGFILMAIPGKSEKGKDQQITVGEINSEITLEQQLATILSQVQGAGRVEVMLTSAAGEEVIYQTDQDNTNGETSSHQKSNTVTVTDANRNQSGLIRQINPERYQGAIIVCQGADNPTVCLSIVDAVSKATGLGANKISVLKMK